MVDGETTTEQITAQQADARQADSHGIQAGRDSGANLHRIDRALVWDGFKQMLPISMFVTIFGAAFGIAATQAHISGTASVVMSALVFAGASQFGALELWGVHIPLFALLVTVFAINARHFLMGATLYPWLKQLPPSRRYGVMMVASDANWAMAMQAFNRGRPGFGLLFGGGLALWLFWIVGTWAGIAFGNAISNPKALGLDMVMGCFLLAMVVGGDKDVRMIGIWVIAAITSILAFYYLPENSHVVVGALAGGIAGIVWAGKEPETAVTSPSTPAHEEVA